METFIGTKTRRSLLLVSVMGLVCFGVLIGGIASPQERQRRPPQPKASTKAKIKTINMTPTLEVALETTDKFLLVKLTNVSSKELNGYVVNLTNQVRITTDLSSGDRVIPPGQTDEFTIPLDDSLVEITILAAMFADGSIEGDPATVAELTQWRLGLKEELRRSLSTLDEMLKSADYPLENLAIQSPPSDASQTVKAGMASGVRAARENLKTEIHLIQGRLQKDQTTEKQELLELRKRIERRIAML